MTYSENGNISAKTNVGQYSYGYDWHRPFAVERVTNAQGVIPSSALSTQFDGRGMVSSIYEYGSWKETTFTYGPDGERWKTVRQAYGEYDVERKYLGDMEVMLSGPGMTRCNWYLGHGVMLFRDADNPVFSSVTPLYAFTDNQGSYIDFYRSNGTRVFNSLFQHEYGHYLQSQSLGLGYLIRVGVPSFLQASFGGNHDFMNYEQDANMRAFRYFNENVPGFYTSPDEYNTQYNDRNIASQKGEKYRWPKWNFEENPLTLKDKYNLMIWYVDYRNIAPYLSYIGDYKIKFFFK